MARSGRWLPASTGEVTLANPPSTALVAAGVDSRPDAPNSRLGPSYTDQLDEASREGRAPAWFAPMILYPTSARRRGVSIVSH